MTSIDYAQIVTALTRLEHLSTSFVQQLTGATREADLHRAKIDEQMKDLGHAISSLEQRLEVAAKVSDLFRAEVSDQLKGLEHNLGALFPPKSARLIFEDEQG